MWLALRIFVFPSWSSTLKDSIGLLFHHFYLSRIRSPSIVSLYWADRLLSTYSLCRNSPARLFRKEAAVSEPQWFFHSKWLLLEVCQWGIDPTGARLGTSQSLCEVWFCIGRGNFVMPFSMFKALAEELWVLGPLLLRGKHTTRSILLHVHMRVTRVWHAQKQASEKWTTWTSNLNSL